MAAPSCDPSHTCSLFKCLEAMSVNAIKGNGYCLNTLVRLAPSWPFLFKVNDSFPCLTRIVPYKTFFGSCVGLIVVNARTRLPVNADLRQNFRNLSGGVPERPLFATGQ